MSDDIQHGDWVTTNPFGYRGTAEVSDRFPDALTIRLDPDHGHFRDTVLSSRGETQLVRDLAVYDAERVVESAARAVSQIDANIRFQQAERRKQMARLAQARKELRAARKVPRVRPADNAVADAALAAAGL